MTLKNKIFGKKIKRSALINLMESLDIPKRYLENGSSNWSVEDYWGKYGSKFIEQGLEIDLYIFRKDVHFYSLSNTEPKYRSKLVFHFEKILSYKNLNSIGKK